MPRRDENIPSRRDGMKIPCKRKAKIVCVSIGSRSIPARRDIAPRPDHVNRPVLKFCKDSRPMPSVDQLHA